MDFAPELEPVVPQLADSFEVLVYEWRGHSESERPSSQGGIRDDVADLCAFDLDWISRFSRPALLTFGDQSPPQFSPGVSTFSETLPAAEIVTYPGAGHVPHATHPERYVETITSFFRGYEH